MAANKGTVPCDCCGIPVAEGYACTSLGVNMCDRCLIGDEADAFATVIFERRAVSIKAIDLLCDGAVGKIEDGQVDELREAVDYARTLFAEGRTDAAMEAGQAAWNLALGVFNAIESRDDVLMGRRVRDGGAKGAMASKKTRRSGDSKRARILSENASYSGSAPARVSTIARRAGATTRYVRKVLRNPEL